MKAGDLVQWVEHLTVEGELILNGLVLFYREGNRAAQVLIPGVGVEWRSVQGMEVVSEDR
jgi:hypothetical protein